MLPTLGGQTALNTAMKLHGSGALERHGIEMIGAKADAIEKGEDRQVFKDLMLSIGLDVPISGTAHNMEEARTVADKIGRFPAHHPPHAYPGRHRRWYCLQPRRI